MNLLIFIVLLSILVIVHEFGHFIVAKLSGVRVERFAIGFGPPIIKIKGKITDFLICLLPLGGYVKLAGDSRSDASGSRDEFLSKPAGIKARIVFAGPVFNYFLAFVLFYLIAIIGFPIPTTVVGKALPDYPAARAGIKSGDRVTKVNGVAVQEWNEMAALIRKSGKTVDLTIQRDSKSIELTVNLQPKELPDNFGRLQKVPMIGISSSSEIVIKRYNPLVAFSKAARTLVTLTITIIKGFVFMILGIIPIKEAVAGPLGIYYITTQAAKIGIVALLHLMAVLSVSLTIVNLFPLPIIDGFHIIVFGFEKLRKRPIPQRLEDMLTRIGFIMLGVIIILIFYNDIIRFGSKIWGKAPVEATQDTIPSKNTEK